MRKWISLLAIIFTGLQAVGCSNNTIDMPYEIIQKNGDCFLIMNNTWLDISDESFGITAAPAITFDTIAEMKNDIKTGNFTEFELNQLAKFEKNEEGQIKICNLNNLYTASFPSELDAYRISWDGEDYSFFVPFQGISLQLQTKEYFNEEIEKRRNFEASTSYKILEKNVEADGQTYSYTYQTASDIIKKRNYKISSNSKNLYVSEMYILDTSNTIPFSISIVGVDNGIYFSAHCLYPSERPTVEWLSQFGVQKYVD